MVEPKSVLGKRKHHEAAKDREKAQSPIPNIPKDKNDSVY